MGSQNFEFMSEVAQNRISITFSGVGRFPSTGLSHIIIYLTMTLPVNQPSYALYNDVTLMERIRRVALK